MTEKTWIKDDNGNRCSVERFGSEEAAKKALESLRRTVVVVGLCI